MKKLLLPKMLAIACILAGFTICAQVKIGNNPTVINSNAILDIRSADKGVLRPHIVLTAPGNASSLSIGMFYKDGSMDSYKLSIIK